MSGFFPKLILAMLGLDRALVNKVTSTNFDPGVHPVSPVNIYL